MKHTHHRDERPEESRARMYLPDSDDWQTPFQRSRSQNVTKAQIEEAILKYLENVDSPLANVVNHLSLTLRGVPNIALISEVADDLYKRGIIEVSGFAVDGFRFHELTVRIRRVGDFKNKPGSAC